MKKGYKTKKNSLIFRFIMKKVNNLNMTTFFFSLKNITVILTCFVSRKSKIKTNFYLF